MIMSMIMMITITIVIIIVISIVIMITMIRMIITMIITVINSDDHNIQMIQLTRFALDSGRSLCRGSLGRLATGCSISMDQAPQLLRGLAAQLCQNLSHYVWRGSFDRQKL